MLHTLRGHGRSLEVISLRRTPLWRWVGRHFEVYQCAGLDVFQFERPPDRTFPSDIPNSKSYDPEVGSRCVNYKELSDDLFCSAQGLLKLIATNLIYFGTLVSRRSLNFELGN
ncbi:hypothetical protein CC2G_001608 [Coprinopsis cinerea AmutBmut pab1-1]|nr:hypothetical protein CC2G_001608 [Coprinopsis cinerea AmutBmut pab1-1]